MTRTTRWMLIFCFVFALIAVAWDFTPLTAGRSKANSVASNTSMMQKQGDQKQAGVKISKQANGKAAEAAEGERPEGEEDDEDPIFPPAWRVELIKKLICARVAIISTCCAAATPKFPKEHANVPFSKWNVRRNS